jgi:endonuclease G
MMRISFLRGQSAQFTPGREVKSAGADPTFEVRRVVMMHPYWDMALLEIPDLPLPALQLAPLDPADGPRLVAVVGYPAFDPRNPTDVQNHVFHKRFDVKRLAPGYVTGRRRVQSFDNVVNAGTHDASSLGGNSGSAVIDVETGHVVGIHFAGVYLDANFAVLARDLWADPRVVQAGARFTSTSPAPTPSSGAAARWREIEGEEQAAPALIASPIATSIASSTTSQAVGEGGVYRVTIPIEITVRVSQVAAPGPSVDPSRGSGEDL